MVTIDAVMTQCNNHFAISAETNVFAIVADGIEGTFTDTYLIGQYVWIKDSMLNDGVYKIASVASDKITFVDTDLIAENTDRIICLYGLAPDKTFISLVAEISAYDDTVTKGIKSESQGNRSVTYGAGSGTGSTSNDWQTVYSSNINAYKRMFDYDTAGFKYNIFTKGW